MHFGVLNNVPASGSANVVRKFSLPRIQFLGSWRRDVFSNMQILCLHAGPIFKVAHVLGTHTLDLA